MPAEKPRRLGRGLEALLASHAAATVATDTSVADPSALRTIAIARIRPNPYQPRKEFDPESLRELQASLSTSGLLNPIAVRTAPGGQGYELIAGERRLRAAAQLGWTEIAAVVREIDDQSLLTLALVENLQRSDLNPIEEAEGYRRLMEQFSLTQVQVAEIVGKERSTVANLLRILQLPAIVRKMLHERQLSLGHARALLALEDDVRIIALAREVVAHGLSVRDVEQRARATAVAHKRRPSKKPAAGGEGGDLAERQAQEDLRRYLQTDVRIARGEGGRGRIEIAFYSTDDLDRLLDLLLGARRTAT
jgi:ParB family transcriptional regulator, chromosome partitioning protein